ncbi:MAG: hypothetical protein V1846_03635, partial [Candidatus Komeilibacteria bacterium]
VAQADAMVLRTVGAAQGAKITAVGSAEADVIKRKIASMESGNYAMIEVARALSKSGFKLVPDVMAGGGGDNGGTLVQVLLAGMIQDSLRRRPQEVRNIPADEPDTTAEPETSIEAAEPDAPTDAPPSAGDASAPMAEGK